MFHHRIDGQSKMNEILAKIGKHNIDIKFITNSEIILNDIKYHVNLSELNNDLFQLSIEGKEYQLYAKEIENGIFQSYILGDDYLVELQTKIEAEANNLLKINGNSNSTKKITAPMNGLIVKVIKDVGDMVRIGESLLVLEAMKMENEIKSISEGTIKTNNCKVGNSVDKGEILFIIE